MNIESTDNWTQGLTHSMHHPTSAFTETLNVPTARTPPGFSKSFFILCHSQFFNPLNIFWYKNKPMYWWLDVCELPLPPSPPVIALPLLHSSILVGGQRNSGSQNLSLPAQLSLGKLKSSLMGGGVVKLREIALKKRFDNLPEKRKQ